MGALMSDIEPAPGPPARPRRADARRNITAILDAATALLAERPRASMHDIAVAAGVHRATVHRHFPARDDLLEAIRIRAIDDLLEVLETSALDEGPAGDAMHRVTRATLESGDRRRVWRFAPSYDQASEARQEAIVGPLVGLFSRAQLEGAARRDVDPVGLVTAWGGLIIAHLNAVATGRMSLEQATDATCAFLAPAR